jgi:cytochrome c553
MQIDFKTVVLLLLAQCLSLTVVGRLIAEDTVAAFFEKEIRPALVQHCVRCHGEEKVQGGLRLDTREGWQAGGDSGPAIIAGDPQSLLLQAIEYEDINLEMPPRGKLPETTIAAFQKWIRKGAFDPRSKGRLGDKNQGNTVTIEQGKKFWAFQPLLAPVSPELSDSNWPSNDIDRFVLAKLVEKGIKPAGDATKENLLRRLTYDLTGLPPTSDQIERFLADESDGATDKVIDRLLQSGHFGERWGRHWLDVVRFAESSGGGRTLLFPDAWRYRDYVIDAFNRDLPFDQFLKEQIAGDLLPSEDRFDRERKLIATGFLMLGPTNYEMQDKDILEMDVVDEQLDTMGKAMLGMTIGCARCHDHKFDPIPTRDYYAMAGILKSTHSMEHSNVSTWNTVELPLAAGEEAAILARTEKLRAIEKKLAAATSVLNKLTGKNVEQPKSVDPGKLNGLVVDSVDADVVGSWKASTSIAHYVGADYIHDEQQDKGAKSVLYRPALPKRGRYEVFASYSAGSNRSTKVPYRIKHRDGETVVEINQRKRPPVDALMQSLGVFEFDDKLDSSVLLFTEGTDDGVVIADAIVWLPILDAEDGAIALHKEKATDAATKVELEVRKKKIAAAKLKVDRLKKEVKALKGSIPKRQVAMAPREGESPADIHVAIRGMTHQKGDIVPRGVLQVAAWEGLPVVSKEVSGRSELAEWVASERNPLTARVIANRVWYWTMGRGIVASVDNFGSTGDSPTHPELLDYLAFSLVQNGWSIKKLVRQIVSSRAYQLSARVTERELALDADNQFYGRRTVKRLRAEDIRDSILMASGNLDLTMGGSTIKKGTSSEYGYKFEGRRRSVYVPVFRNRLPEIFEVFDFADPNIQGGTRTASNVASQALLMMNQPFVMGQADDAAKRLVEDYSGEPYEMLRRAYREVLGREPFEQERQVMMDLLAGEDQLQTPSQWAMVYRLLFQCIDFRYLN